MYADVTNGVNQEYIDKGEECWTSVVNPESQFGNLMSLVW